jgi:hypothetical protein
MPFHRDAERNKGKVVCSECGNVEHREFLENGSIDFFTCKRRTSFGFWAPDGKGSNHMYYLPRKCKKFKPKIDEGS